MTRFLDKKEIAGTFDINDNLKHNSSWIDWLVIRNSPSFIAVKPQCTPLMWLPAAHRSSCYYYEIIISFYDSKLQLSSKFLHDALTCLFLESYIWLLVNTNQWSWTLFGIHWKPELVKTSKLCNIHRVTSNETKAIAFWINC